MPADNQSVKDALSKKGAYGEDIDLEHYDEGEVIAQYRCAVLPDDTAADVAAKVHALEYEYYPQVIGREVMR